METKMFKYAKGGILEKIEKNYISFPIGMKVYSFGPGCSDSIYAVCSEKNEHGMQKLVKISKHYKDDYFGVFGRLEEYAQPVSKKFGIGFYFDDIENYIFDSEIIEAAVKNAELIVLQEIEEAKQLEISNKNEQIELLKKYSYLQENRNNETKITIQNIREYVKVNFKGVKFSVRKDGYNCIRITYFNHEKINNIDNLRMFIDHTTDHTGDYRDFDPSNFNTVFGGSNYVFINFEQIEKKEVKEVKEVKSNTINTNFEIIDYSEKSFAVIGDTKKIKDLLKSNGGKFNMYLKCGAGWIFPISKKELVLNLIK